MKNLLSLFAITLLFTLMTFAKDNSQVNKSKNGPFIIDVRTEQEYNSGNIQGSYLMPFDVISSKITAVVPNKDSKIILYCRSGRRSGIAEKTLKDMGYKNVENYGSMQAAKDRLGIK
jgi:phage shock protein E